MHEYKHHAHFCELLVKQPFEKYQSCMNGCKILRPKNKEQFGHNFFDYLYSHGKPISCRDTEDDIEAAGSTDFIYHRRRPPVQRQNPRQVLCSSSLPNSSLYLYQIVTHYMLRTHNEKQVFLDKKCPICACSPTNQKPYTGQITETFPYMRTYL